MKNKERRFILIIFWAIVVIFTIVSIYRIYRTFKTITYFSDKEKVCVVIGGSNTDLEDYTEIFVYPTKSEAWEKKQKIIPVDEIYYIYHFCYSAGIELECRTNYGIETFAAFMPLLPVTSDYYSAMESNLHVGTNCKCLELMYEKDGIRKYAVIYVE